MRKYFEIAKFGKTQGLKGELRAQFFGDSPLDFEFYPKFYLGSSETASEVFIEKVRPSNTVVVIKLKGVDSLEQAQTFVGKSLFVCRDDVKLPEGVWYVDDLIGIVVVDADSGEEYGELTEVLQNAPTDVYVLKAKSGRELLFPATEDFIVETDIPNRIMKIRVIEGLFDV